KFCEAYSLRSVMMLRFATSNIFIIDWMSHLHWSFIGKQFIFIKIKHYSGIGYDNLRITPTYKEIHFGHHRLPLYASKLRRSVWVATLGSAFLMLAGGHEGAPLRLVHSTLYFRYV
ncbi:MAG: hypothetical protein ACR2IL_06815, partial [Chitinophagaceae bacterium]